MHPEEDRKSVISLFAGAGGSSLGYQAAGFIELLAVEFDQNAVDCLKANFDFPVWSKDIKGLSVSECLKLAQIKPGELDVLDGSPPCQGFSTAGARHFDDDKNKLFKEYIRLLRGLKPKVFVLENVSGLIKGKMKLIFAEIMKELKQSGYNVKCKLMNAKYYDVPQSRQRVIFIGTRLDLGHPSFPSPQRNLLAADEAIVGADLSIMKKYKSTSKIETMIKKCKPGQNVSSAYGVTSYFNWSRCAAGKPAQTIIKTLPMYHPHEDRWLSIGEVKRLQTFPDTYAFSGSYHEQLARLGNAVPPKMMEAIARHISVNIL